MTLVHATLASLELPTMTGNQLKKSFEMTLGQFWTTPQSRIDDALIDLKKEGWGEKKIIKQEDQPNLKEYSITKTRRVGVRRGMALLVIGARSLEKLAADLGMTGPAVGSERMPRVDQISQPDFPSPTAFARLPGNDHA